MADDQTGCHQVKCPVYKIGSFPVLFFLHVLQPLWFLDYFIALFGGKADVQICRLHTQNVRNNPPLQRKTGKHKKAITVDQKLKVSLETLTDVYNLHFG